MVKLVQPNRWRGIGRVLVIASLGLATAVASAAQSAAEFGAVIPAFRPLGPSFYAWRADLLRAEIALHRRATPQRAQLAARAAQTVVTVEPLATAGWRTLARAKMGGNNRQARAVMVAADRLSRRDPAIQAWLLEDGIQRRQVASTLVHFDALIRTEPEARDRLLRQLAVVLENAQARRDLIAYVRADNPWFGDFNRAAISRPGSIMPYASLLQQVRTLPAGAYNEQSYAAVVTRLVREGQFTALRNLYPRLPGADSGAMRSISLSETDDPRYPPIGWVLSEEPDRGAALIQSSDGDDTGAIEIFADPLISAVVANRLIWPPANARTIRWRVADREGARGASANLQLRCLDAVERSENLLERQAASSIAIPANCPVAMLELAIFGGTGRDPATVVIDRLAFGEVPQANRNSQR
jgi:hypothetical protein